MTNNEGGQAPLDNLLQDARVKIDAAIKEFVDLLHKTPDYADLGPEHKPYIAGWLIAYEWTSIDFTRTGLAGRSIIAPEEQLVSTSLGLAVAAQRAYEPQRYQ